MLDHFTSLGRARKSLLNERKRIPPCNRISRHGVSENHPALDSWCWQWWEAYYQMTKKHFLSSRTPDNLRDLQRNKKTRVSYVNHRWEPTSKKYITVRVPQASAMEKNIAPKNGHDVSIRVGWTPLALLRGSCAKFRHPRREKTKVAQVASSARSMQSSTFFSYFGLECVRLWTMGNFSLEN